MDTLSSIHQDDHLGILTLFDHLNFRSKLGSSYPALRTASLCKVGAWQAFDNPKPIVCLGAA